MIQPKELELFGKTFILSKFPAMTGREIVTQYVATGLPKVGDYPRNEELALKLLSYVGVKGANDTVIQLKTKALVESHIQSTEDYEGWEMVGRIEVAMMEYNCSFFRNGRASGFFNGFAQNLKQWIIQTLTDFSEQSSMKEKPRSTN